MSIPFTDILVLPDIIAILPILIRAVSCLSSMAVSQAAGVADAIALLDSCAQVLIRCDLPKYAPIAAPVLL